MPMTPKEADFLNKLDGVLHTNEKGKYEKKLSPLEQRIHNAVEKELNKEGETSQEAIMAFINKEIDDAVAEVAAGKSKDGGELPEQEKKTFHEQRAEKNATNKANNAIRGVTNQAEGRVARVLNRSTGGAINIQEGIKQLGKLVTKTPEQRAEDVNDQFPQSRLDKIEQAAKDAHLPEKSDAIGPLILAADKNQDNKLDKGELQALIKDPKFKEAAQKVSGVANPKVTAQNEKNDQLDAVSVGAAKYVLNEQQAGMRLDDAVPSGDIGAPAATPASAKPAKAASKHK